MITARIQPIDKDIALAVREDLSPEAQRRALARFAIVERDQALAINTRAIGYAPPYETYVNGARGAPLESINPNGGTFLFEFELVGDAFEWIEAQLIINSPIGPEKRGHYAHDHEFFADGAPASPQNPRPASEWMFTNTRPYARKLERRLHIYESTAALAKARFGNLMNFKFTYRNEFPAIVIRAR